MDTWVVTAVSMSAFALHSQLRSALIFNNTKKKNTSDPGEHCSVRVTFTASERTLNFHTWEKNRNDAGG